MNNPDMPPLAVDLKKAAAISGLSRETLRRYIDRKQLARIRVGRKVLIAMDDLRRFLDGHKE